MSTGGTGEHPGAYAIDVDGLTKSYGDHTAVDHISFGVGPGTVTGFLGPNGAGKSTTMRMMVGLTPPTAGRCTVLGRPYRHLPDPGRRVGVLLDASAQHPGRTGREILTLGTMMMGLDTRRVDEVLDLVGLTPAEARRRTGDYSLGMRQRLGVGHALLGEPQVLILDEPANGLDPAGIHWMRGLLRDFADHGGSILLSSHLLREVEVIADELVVIGLGKIVAQGAKKDLLASAGTFVRASDDRALAAALTAAGIDHSAAADGGFLTREPTERISRTAAQAGVEVVELRDAGQTGLEEMFLSLTADHSREKPAGKARAKGGAGRTDGTAKTKDGTRR
ncbi:ATP-binding cassette domain-containing protein [Streptomyces sp. WMMC500]|uniref:ATP-binding cassette domain-containing protein n=1 Tax=Streptomyces sp. WMMC500 TaxID=3015154 RepID=UPI00248CE16C|nr:ATP-binding cassette domain-containing protein [Streptomyces sp. WMMC500]WBB62457.1 ATP-binding cassette domain-containing protein [Streptomyces sp. WMMC500]